MNQTNYQRKLDQLLKTIEGRPSLLLHSCCGPCSSYVLDYLSKYFTITVFFYNPQIDTKEEYDKRLREQMRLIELAHRGVDLVEGPWEPEVYESLAEGLEGEREGGKRCYACYDFRLKKAADYANTHGYPYFATSLSVSPYKNHLWINEIGEKWARVYGLTHLPSDFKKRDGYKKSVEFSKTYQLYRQGYCGCIYSKTHVERDENRGNSPDR